ncbi:MAG: CoA transferase [Chloroflexi bacterium]|nr:CoA transferase [Chloroflexota bacterium]
MTPPLTGIRVVDLADTRAELAGRLLADLGAEVIKVEPPGGAAARRLPPFDHDREGDPEASLYWAAVALGKRSVVLDVTTPEGRDAVRRLAAGADILVESFAPGRMKDLGLGYEDLAPLNPALIYVSVSAFGQDGPMANVPATDLTVEAAGGLIGLQGDRDRPPVPVGYPQAFFHAGAQAAADAVIALNERAASGLGQYLDVAAQPAMVWTLMNAAGFPPTTGGDPPGQGEARGGPPADLVPGVAPRNNWPCADGFVVCPIGLGGMGARTFDRVVRWLEAEDALDPALRGRSWLTWSVDVVEGQLTAETINAVFDAVGRFFATKTKRDLFARAVRDDILLAPVYTPADIASDPQLEARDYWRTLGGRRHPGLFVKMSRTPAAVERPAPRLGEHQALLDAPPKPMPAAVQGRARTLAFEGVRVADFAWVGVGPMTSKALADHGATAIHVESATRPDILRIGGPFRDGIAGIDRSQFMANFNTSKLGLALNIATETGQAIARRLIAWADVVVESFTPGTMQRAGLDYASVSKERPELIYVSTCLRGQTGPERTYGGFGGQGAALAGPHGLTGWPDRAPAGTWGAYTDFIAPRYGIAALGSAILERRRSGLGQYIDLGQVEAAIHFVEPLILDYTVNGRDHGPAGHDSARACPHGVYATAGKERYVAIAVETAGQWQALRAIAPLDAFAGSECDTLPGRVARRTAIDAAVRSWAADQEPFAFAARLRDAGVPAYVVLRPTDLYNDPQLSHRGHFVTLDHTVMGPTPYDGLVTKFSATPGRLRSAAPCLGEHTHHVLHEILGYSEDEIVEFAAAGILT